MREAIRDTHNHVLAYYHYEGDGTIRVTDEHQRITGYVTEHGTFDAHRQRVSWQKEPGLLVPPSAP